MQHLGMLRSQVRLLVESIILSAYTRRFGQMEEKAASLAKFHGQKQVNIISSWPESRERQRLYRLNELQAQYGLAILKVQLQWRSQEGFDGKVLSAMRN